MPTNAYTGELSSVSPFDGCSHPKRMKNLEQYRGTIYDFSDTSKMRGAWHKMFCDAAKADGSTHEERVIVCSQIRNHCEHFQCLKCKAHYVRYLDNNPPEGSIEKKDGLFDWTLEFANSVSKAKGKELYDRKIIYPMFHSGAYLTCDSGCDSRASEGSTTAGDGKEAGSVTIRSRSHVANPRGLEDDVRVTYSEGDYGYRRQAYDRVIR